MKEDAYPVGYEIRQRHEISTTEICRCARVQYKNLSDAPCRECRDPCNGVSELLALNAFTPATRCTVPQRTNSCRGVGIIDFDNCVKMHPAVDTVPQANQHLERTLHLGVLRLLATTWGRLDDALSGSIYCAAGETEFTAGDQGSLASVHYYTVSAPKGYGGSHFCGHLPHRSPSSFYLHVTMGSFRYDFCY